MVNGTAGPDSPRPPIVLVAAADDSFRSFLEYTVGKEDLVVAGVSDGKGVTERLQELTPDVLLLESLLPDIETRSLCGRLRLDRRTRFMSIIVLAAEDDPTREQEFLEAGADKYLSRPYSPATLMASIGTIWRNSNRVPALQQELLTFRDLELDVTRHRVRRNGCTIHLGPTEFRLLHQFMKHPHRVYSRDELQNAAWPRAVHIGPRTVDVHVGRLRAALKQAGSHDLIRTVRSVGYALSE